MASWVCDNCGAKYRLPASFSGDKAKCKQCGSVIDVAAQKAFEQKYRLPFRLIADSERKVMDAFGVPHTGKFASRQAFLFKDGVLVWRDLTASTAEQAADVLEALKTL